MKNIFEIANISINPGESKYLKLDLPGLYNTSSIMPFFVINGKKTGKKVFISACIHGNEINGIEIIRRLKKQSILKKIKGTLILIPCVNVYGLNNQTRYMPDRRDLNRSFPGSKNGSLASRVAKIFFEEIVLKCDFGIDLHTGAIHRSNFPQTRVDFEDKQSLELAKAFGAPVILNSPYRENSLRYCSKQEGVRVLLYESGEALRYDETCIRIGVQGVLNVLKHLEMLPNQTKKRKLPVLTNSSSWVRATSSGAIRTIKKLGDTVSKDEIIGYVDMPLNEISHEIISNADGIIIGRSEIPLVQEGDAIFHIASFKNLTLAENKIEYFQEDATNSEIFEDDDDIV